MFFVGLWFLCCLVFDVVKNWKMAAKQNSFVQEGNLSNNSKYISVMCLKTTPFNSFVCDGNASKIISII